MKKVFAFIMMAFMIGNLSSFCQNSPEKKVFPGSVAPGVEKVALAKQLIDFGYANKDPYSLLTASKILKGFTTGTIKIEKDPKGKGNSLVLDQKGIDIKKLLDDARRFAGQNPAFETLVAEVEKSGSKGATDGPKYGEGVIAGNTTTQCIVNFRGLEPAVIVVVGDGNADLDLFVYDADGKLIVSDETVGSEAKVAFIPTATANFRISLKNCGTRESRFAMATN
jgi:hypothetical protein